MKALIAANLLAIFACALSSNASSAADIDTLGYVPQSIRAAATKALRLCGMPTLSRHIYHRMEGSSRQAYVLELTRKQFEDRSITHCLTSEIKSLGIASDLTLGEEAPLLRHESPRRAPK